jgi:DNA processing protein
MTNQEAFIALNMIPGLGPVRTRSLLERFGSPQAILTAKSSQILPVQGIGAELASTIQHWEDHVDLATELDKARKFGATILTWDDPAYPEMLKEIHAPPVVLYVWGRVEPIDRQSIGIVGSRRSTHYGEEAAKRLSYQLAYAGVTVVSGLARGIDTAAHQGALAAKGRTIACIGSGLLELYPPENLGLAERISSCGAVVSEFPMSTKPDRQTFPMRNRIISGWSCGTLVVEAPLRSGALITVDQAMEQGRSVYAVPGGIDRPTSQGCNRLIQQGAKLVMSASDILDDLGLLFPEKSKPVQSDPAERFAPELGESEQVVYRSIGEDETHIDQIIAKSGLPSSAVLSALLMLELKQLAKQLPGKYFVRLG